jgi:hypothetical protein
VLLKSLAWLANQFAKQARKESGLEVRAGSRLCYWYGSVILVQWMYHRINPTSYGVRARPANFKSPQLNQISTYSIICHFVFGMTLSVDKGFDDQHAYIAMTPTRVAAAAAAIMLSVTRGEVRWYCRSSRRLPIDHQMQNEGGSRCAIGCSSRL